MVKEKRVGRLEKDFQSQLIQELKLRFSGCVVLKNDSGYIQGFPDLLILHNNKWAALECKRELCAGVRPNQEYYVNKLDKMSFSRFISPENKESILYELQQSFES